MSVAAPISPGDFNRLPPQNLDAEQGLLGSILLLNQAIDDVADVVSSQQFYSDRHQRIYSGITRLYDSGVRGIDILTLAEELDRRGDLEEAGGASYLMEILEAVPNASHAKYYAEIVRDKFIQRSLTQACSEILSECYDGSRSTSEVLQSAEQRIFRILEQQEEATKIAIGDILIDTFDRINERLQQEGSISGLSTGFADLDRQLNGFHSSELIILAARPSMGKTALACNIAEAVAREQNAGVIIFSLEQSKLELAERFLCIRSKVNGHRLRAGELDDDEHDHLMQASSELSEIPLYIDDRPGRSMAQIAAICRRLKRRQSLGLILIDYLQLIEPEEKHAPREQQISLITRRLKFLAKEMNIPVVALAQLNRGVELREDKRPRLADLRESGAIEQDADLVMFLHRPEAYNPEEDPGEAHLIIAKNRNGPTGIVKLTWIRESMRFENYINPNIADGEYFADDGGF